MSNEQIKGFTGLAQLSMDANQLESVKDLAMSNRRYVQMIQSPLLEWSSLAICAVHARGFAYLDRLPWQPKKPKPQRTLKLTDDQGDMLNSLEDSSPSEVMVGIWGVTTDRRALVAKQKAEKNL